MQLQIKSERFCRTILDLELGHSKALTSLILSLSSNRDANSPVGLSESALYGHSYSSISQVVSTLSVDKSSHEAVQKKLQGLYLSYYLPHSEYVFQTDVTPVEKPHSDTMSERQYINTPNQVIPFNKNLGIGHNYSYINLGYTPPQGGARWSLPLDIERVTPNSDAISTALMQTKRLMENKALPFGTAPLVINEADSGYATPRFIAPLVADYANMVSVVRLRGSTKVWQQASVNTNKADKVGRTPIYGETTFYLQAASGNHTSKNGKTKELSLKYRTAIYDLPADETIELKEQTSKGRALIIHLKMWRNLMIRTKNGENMQDKSFNLIAVQVIDEQTGELLFKRPMFIAIFGQQKNLLTPQRGFYAYRQRYDIEVHNRFSKGPLMLDKYQTPDVQTLDNWTLIVACAYWLLFIASPNVELMPKPWERNLPQYKNKPTNVPHLNPQKSVAQTKKAAFDLFSTFDLKPFAPKSVNNGKGRKTGTRLPKRKNKKVVKKSDFHNKTRQNE